MFGFSTGTAHFCPESFFNENDIIRVIRLENAVKSAGIRPSIICAWSNKSNAASSTNSLCLLLDFAAANLFYAITSSWSGFISKIHELYNEAAKGDEKKKIKFNLACRLIGLFSMSREEWESSKKSKLGISESYIMKKIEERTKAKKDGNFSLADKIRKELLSKGITIEDQKDKTVWKLK